MCWPHQMFHHVMILLLCTLPTNQYLNRIFQFPLKSRAESISDVNSIEAAKIETIHIYWWNFFASHKKKMSERLTFLAIWISEPIWHRSQMSGLFSNRTSWIFCSIIAWLSSIPFNWFRDISNNWNDRNKSDGEGKKHLFLYFWLTQISWEI